MSKKLSEKQWWRNLILAGAAIAILPLNLFAQDADDEEELEELEAFTMVGSRISSIDATPISPVLQLSSEDLENSGYTTIGDALRALPFNNGQSLTPTDSGTSFTPGISTMNLRGIGNNNTLVLINGRRGAPYAAPGYNGFQTMFDLDSIPDAAIETINIEKDGASALYGSDAVAGVVDFQLRSDYEGTSLKLKVGNYIDTDGFERSASMVYGTSTAKDSIIVAMSYSREEAVYARDLDYTADADNSDADVKNDGWVYSDPEAAYAEGYTDDDLVSFFGGPVEGGWWDQRSVYEIPGSVYYVYDLSDPDSDGTYLQTEEPTSSPSWDNAVAGRMNHPYNYQNDSTLFPFVEKYSLYTRIKHDVNERLFIFSEVSYSRRNSIVDSAPSPASLASDHGLTADVGMTIPVWNEYNFLGQTLESGYRRLVETGNRSNDVTSEAPRYLAGIGGKLAGDWTWEAAAVHSASEVSSKAAVVIDYKLQQALNGLTQQGDGSYVYDEGTAYADRTYFNWFGYNDDDEMVEFLQDYNITSAEYILEYADFHLSGTVMELPAGPLGVAFGGEYREESLENNKTDLNETGMIVGGGEGTSSSGSRDVTSFFTEFRIPATKWLEFQLAGRWESYSDEGYGSEIRPKIGVKIKPFDWLAIRASFGESFKAPDLAYLYTTSQTSFSSGNVTDPVTSESKQVQIKSGGNPDLMPETTDSYYIGFVLEPKGVLEGLTVSFDYIRYESENILTQLSDIYGYNEFLTRAAQGDELFVDKVVRDSSGALLYILDDYMNISESTYTAYDFEIKYTYETEKAGTFSVGTYITYLDSYEIDGDEVAGSRTMPEWRGNVSMGWRKGDWSANVFVNYIGERNDIVAYSYDLDYYWGLEDVYAYLKYDIGAQIIVNPSVSYRGLWNSTFTLGIYNLFNDEPPVDPYDGLGYTSGVNVGMPFSWYLSWKKEF